MNERDAFKTDNIGLEMTNRELEAKIASIGKEIGDSETGYKSCSE